MSDSISGLTTCIHCGQKFTHPKFSVIGKPTARLEEYLEHLAKHLGTKHPEQSILMAQNVHAFAELMFLENFHTTDTELAEQRDRVRWQVHQQTLKARYPDKSLEKQAREIAESFARQAMAEVPGEFKNKFRSHVDIWEADLVRYYTFALKAILASIRDALEEPGKYSTVTQSPNVMV